MTDKYAAWRTPAPEKKHWFAWLHRRSVHITAFTLLIMALVSLSVIESRHALREAGQAASVPVDVLGEQYALILAGPVYSKNGDVIALHLSRLAETNFILAAAVFDNKGKRLGVVTQKSSVTEESPEQNHLVRLFSVKDDHGSQTGVLQLTVDSARLLNDEYALLQSERAIQAGILMTGLFAGCILTAAGWRYRYYFINKMR
ncbi:MAG: hypothetical protein CL587_15645 [Alteromonadaceae bacterium]|nr:hypothetical protein [Alteromonadaceae bacterium]